MIDIKELIKYRSLLQKIGSSSGGTIVVVPGGGDPAMGGVSGGGSSEDVCYVTFMNEDGTVELGKKAVITGDDCADPIDRGLFSVPTKESTAQYSYTFYGWATTPNGAADSNALKAVEEDRTVYANFAAAVRYYTVRFYDDDTLLTSRQAAYGSSVEYVPDDKEGYSFVGWVPAPMNITGDMDCYAQFGLAEIVSRKLVERTISGDYVNNRVTSTGDYAFKNCGALTSVDLPAVTSIGKDAFSSCSLLTAIILRNTSGVVTNPSSYSLSGTPGYIYVPAALVDNYKSATNWSMYANKIRAIEDYPDICGGEK